MTEIPWWPPPLAATRAVHLAGIIKETAENRYVDAHQGTARALGSLDAIRMAVYVSVGRGGPGFPERLLRLQGGAAESLMLSGRAADARVARSHGARGG